MHTYEDENSDLLDVIDKRQSHNEQPKQKIASTGRLSK